MKKYQIMKAPERYYDDEDMKIENQYDSSIDDDVQALLQNSKEKKLQDALNEIFDDLDEKQNVTENPEQETSQSIETIKNNFKLQNQIVNAHCDSNFSYSIYNTRHHFYFSRNGNIKIF